MKKYLLMMMAALAMVTFVACGDDNKEDDEPIVTTDTRILSVVPNMILAEIKQHMPIYDGVNPPIVEGSYCMGPDITLVFDNYYGWDNPPVWTANYIEFTQQKTSERTLYFRESNKSGSFVGSGTGAYICGDGKNFTVYLSTKNTENKDDGSTITYNKITLISGTLTDKGISKLRYAFVITDKKGDPDDEYIMKEGVIRVVKDDDEFSDAI
jgi:hypothetical protein